MDKKPYWTEDRLRSLVSEIDEFEAVWSQASLSAGQRKKNMKFVAQRCSDTEVRSLLLRDLDRPKDIGRAIHRAREHVETLRYNHKK